MAEGVAEIPFERRLIGLEFALCQRYYQRITDFLVGGNTGAGGTVFTDVAYPTRMRAAPTAAYIGALVYSNASLGAVESTAIDKIRLRVVITAAGNGYSFGAILALDSEL